MEHVMRNNLLVVLAVMVAMVGLGAGCGSDTTTEDGNNPASDSETLDPNVDWNSLQLVYSPMYSAFDGGAHVYSLPCYANGVSTTPEQWQSIPSDAVTFDGWQSADGTQQGVLITVAKYYPDVTIAVSDGAVGGQATLYITNATADQWTVGQERYVRGNMFDISQVAPQLASMFSFENGMPMFTVNGESLNTPTDLRCDACHTADAEDFQVEHTPTQAARFSDAELVNIFTNGTKPEGVGYRALPMMFQDLYVYFHTWDVTPAEAEGLTIYLRSLAPKGQGEIALPGIGLLPDDVNLDQLPDACNPAGGMFDLATCTGMLGPECDRSGPSFDLQACIGGLGIMLPEGFADIAGMFGGFGMQPAANPMDDTMDDTMMDDTMMDDTMMDDTMMDDTMMDDTTTTDAGMGM